MRVISNVEILINIVWKYKFVVILRNLRISIFRIEKYLRIKLNA